jgi:hypothetical protein
MAQVTLDYAPSLDGEPYDPAPAGGAVERLLLFTDAARATPPVVNVGPAAVVEPGRYRFTFDAPPDGLYYAAIDWRETAESPVFRDTNDVVQFPIPTAPEEIPPGLVLAVDVVARRAGFPLPLTPLVREVVAEAILDAQSDVEAYLGRPIVPTQRVESGLYAHPSGWLLSETPLKIVSAQPEFGPADANGVALATGLFTVTYLTGIDAARDPAFRPIRRYVLAHAAALARQHPVASTIGVKRGIRSVNVEGQGITYSDEVGSANTQGGGSGAVGTLPVIESLSAFRQINVFQRATNDVSRQARAGLLVDDGPWL